MAGWTRAAQWIALTALSFAFVITLMLVRLPAALLIGPMAAAVILALSGARPGAPRGVFVLAQGVIGCMIARGVPVAVVGEIAKDWPLALFSVVSVVIASNILGYALAKRGGLPGTTAVWGSSAGAASAMTLMSESFGADIRLVAFMQYARVVVVVLAASVVSRLWATPGAELAIDWWPPVDWPAFGLTLVVAWAGALAGKALKIPAGALLTPLALTIALQWSGLLTPELPEWLLAAAYAIVGWSIGLRFDRAIFLHAARALPRIMSGIVALIALCGGIAAALHYFAGVDPLTAYLATSPGGADSVAIIAASSSAIDLPFVMALQTLRLIVVILTGPALARFVARRVERARLPGVA
ncbi:AbrB family transcriptional regulator [Hansschlegelia quercus]|uniref:AbrB family transcriptional regulator n=1 Tax=Hansschlegelia quercus TaxID=2528245 RepID=UPI001FE2364B|nr:AbrB family transcriptional regulator [Hansschlegelia quercus]